MHVAFVEVRDKTALLAAVASRLTDMTTSWLVQNHHFADPSMQNATVLPYPSPSVLRSSPNIPTQDDAALEAVRETDRFTTHFGRTPLHYAWYYERIARWLDETRPDIIVGEVGNFHSHMVAVLGAQRGIPFLNPVSSRYPTGRFSFFLGDRLVPVGGAPEDLSEYDLESLAAAIARGVHKPDYMSVSVGRRARLAYRTRTLAEWLRGERWATQSPVEFARATARRKRVVRSWDAAAAPLSQVRDLTRPRILYPLQMQPELNLDVWGRAYRAQERTILSLAAAARRMGGTVLVKPNPKSFHEMSGALRDLVSAEPAVVGLAHEVKMDEIIADMDVVVTVSGTVAIERLLRREPVMILLDDYARWLGVPSLQDLGVRMEGLTADDVRTVADAQQAIAPAMILNRLIGTSYRGIISEPLLAPHVMEEANLRLIAAAIRDVAPIAVRAARAA